MELYGDEFYWIGVDCGKDSTGVAVWEAGARQFTTLETTTFFELLDWLDHWFSHMKDQVVICVEDPNKNKSVHHDGGNWRKTLSIAQRVGMVKRETSLMIEALHRRDFWVHTIRPKRSKMDADKFEAYTGCTIRSNQDNRDAALLVYGRRPPTKAQIQHMEAKKE